MKAGALDSVTKELIYVAVSMTNSCEYCTKSHTAAAKKKGATDEMIKEMIDVMGVANQNNKLVEAYGVEVDENIPLDHSKISTKKFFYDVIYNPSETNFLRIAKKNGNKIENGN